MHSWDSGQGWQLVAGDGGVTSSDQLGVTMLQIAWVVERKELCGQDFRFLSNLGSGFDLVIMFWVWNFCIVSWNWLLYWKNVSDKLCLWLWYFGLCVRWTFSEYWMNYVEWMFCDFELLCELLEMNFCVIFEFVLLEFWNNNKLLPTMDNFDNSRRKFCVLCYFHFRWKLC